LASPSVKLLAPATGAAAVFLFVSLTAGLPGSEAAGGICFAAGAWGAWAKAFEKTRLAAAAAMKNARIVILQRAVELSLTSNHLRGGNGSVTLNGYCGKRFPEAKLL